MSLNLAIKEANNKGVLGLMVYVIPNFPDPDIYQETLEILNDNPYVTIIEITFPVTSCFSEFANTTIQNAHRKAALFADGASVLETLQPFKKPTVCVLYRETFEKLGYETILKKIQGKIDGLLFEWDIPDIENYVQVSEHYDVELVQCAGSWMTEDEMSHSLSLAKEEPIVYLVSAPVTGGEIFSAEEIAACVKNIKEHRPDAMIAAGFGIGNARDVEMMSRIKGLDAVIIGTAFLKKMEQGTTEVLAFLDEITPALKM